MTCFSESDGERFDGDPERESRSYFKAENLDTCQVMCNKAAAGMCIDSGCNASSGGSRYGLGLGEGATREGIGGDESWPVEAILLPISSEGGERPREGVEMEPLKAANFSQTDDSGFSSSAGHIII